MSDLTTEALRRHKAEQAEQKLLLGPIYEDQGLVRCKEDGKPWPPDLFTTDFIEFIEKIDLNIPTTLLRFNVTSGVTVTFVVQQVPKSSQ